MSKPRSDSKLKNLPEERQEQIIDWARMPKTAECPGGLRHAMEQLAADGIKVSIRAVSEFVTWWELQRQFSDADIAARFVEEQMREFDPSNSEKAAAAGQYVFTNLSIQKGDPQTFVALQRLDLDRKTAKSRGEIDREKLKQADRRIAILERRESKTKALLQDESLTLEQRETKMRAVFGIHK